MFQFAQLKQPVTKHVLTKTDTTTHWIVYSSGTTGNPKGIAFSESAILNSINSRYCFSDYSQSDQVACSIYFFWERTVFAICPQSGFNMSDRNL